MRILFRTNRCSIISKGKSLDRKEREEGRIKSPLGTSISRITLSVTLLKITPDNVSTSDVSRGLSRLKQSEEPD